jgi:YidC/Oxa1 family membrane protein insertase
MKMMQQMTLMMTFMFGIFTIQVPAGLTLYWVTSNLLQILQQWITTSGRFNLLGSNTKVLAAVSNADASATEKGSALTSATVVQETVAAGAGANKTSASQKQRRKAKRK